MANVVATPFFAGDLGEFNNTHKGSVAGSSASFTPTGPYKRYLIFVTTDTHIALNREATTGDFLLAAGGYAYVHLDIEANDPQAPSAAEAPAVSINWIEDSASGDIYITECGSSVN